MIVDEVLGPCSLKGYQNARSIDSYICGLTRIFQTTSILDILTRAVSTSREMANVLILARTSPSFGWGLLEAALIPPCIPPTESGTLFLAEPSRTPTVNYPRAVISSARDCYSKRIVLVNKLSKESERICMSELSMLDIIPELE